VVPAQISLVTVEFEETEWASQLEVLVAQERDEFVVVCSRPYHRVVFFF
jgi:hypothetical protein